MPNKDTVLAVISDVQVGSTVAVCPPKWNLDEGGTFHASPAQKIMYRKWQDTAKNVKDMLTENKRRKRLVLVLNGEPIDGDHHGTPQLITKNKQEQIDMFISLLDEWLDIVEYDPKRGDCIYLVRGTTAHESGERIEQIGRDIEGVVPYRRDSGPLAKDGRYHYQKIRKSINDVYFRIQHHGFGRGTRPWTRENAILYSLKSQYIDCLDYKKPIPDATVCSHFHVYNFAYYYGKQKTMFGCTTPCWQLKTHFVNRVAPLEDINTIGNIYFDVTASGLMKPVPDFIEVEDAPITEF